MLCIAPSGRAQFSNLDRLGEEFAKRLKSYKPRKIGVADFSPSGDALPSQGHYFAQSLTLSLRHHGKKLFIIDHDRFDAAVTSAHLSTASFSSPERAGALAGKVPEDVVIIGKIGRDGENYNFEVSAVHVSDGKILFTQGTTLHRTGFLDSFSEPFPPKVGQPVYTAGVNRTGIPTCMYCPAPEYNDFARREKTQGSVVFEVLISPEGQAVSLKLVKSIGYGLDEKAFDAIKSWRFKAAAGADGSPVYVRVPIEVTFHLY
jgi:TonB family protein